MNNKISQFVVVLTILTGIQSHSYALEVGDKAPCVVLNQIHSDGSESEGCIRETEEDKHAFTAIEFFSIDCSDCATNLPKLKSIQNELSERATFRLVSIDKNETRVREFIKNNNLGLSVALDLNRDAKMSYHITETPTLIILGRNNTVYYKHTGILDDSEIQRVKNILGL